MLKTPRKLNVQTPNFKVFKIFQELYGHINGDIKSFFVSLFIHFISEPIRFCSTSSGGWGIKTECLRPQDPETECLNLHL